MLGYMKSIPSNSRNPDYEARAGRAEAGGGSRQSRPSCYVLVILATLLAGCGYGQIQEMEEQVRSARQEIEIQLQKRAELVPSLLETLQANNAVGDELAGAVADARADLVFAFQSGDLAAIQTANAELCAGLEEILASAAGDARLQADPAFELLQSQLDATEQQVEQAGRQYNEAVRGFNEFIEGFPQLVTARVIRAEKLEPFQSRASPRGASSSE
jgi:LemA protein